MLCGLLPTLYCCTYCIPHWGTIVHMLYFGVTLPLLCFHYCAQQDCHGYATFILLFVPYWSCLVTPLLLRCCLACLFHTASDSVMIYCTFPLPCLVISTMFYLPLSFTQTVQGHSFWSSFPDFNWATFWGADFFTYQHVIH